MTYDNVTGNVNGRYVHGPNVDENLNVQSNGNEWYYHTDSLGSVTALTDDTGTVVKSFSYDSFGNTGPISTNTVTSVASQVGYYTINDGMHFTRTSGPSSTATGNGTVSQTINTDGSVNLTISNSPGYADDGFYLRVGTLGDFNGLQIATSADSNPISVNIWFDVDNNGEFFVWSGNVLSSLGNDAYILGPSSVQNVLSVNGNSNFTSLNPGGGNYTLAQLKSGAVAGITSTTKIAIWVGIATNGGSLSATVNSIQNPVLTPFTYTGREYDPESGLYYYRARYYDASTGRFISKDPIGFAGGYNLYAYVGNNPVKWNDPSGTSGIPGMIIGGFAGAVGGYTSGLISGNGNLTAAVLGGVAGGTVGALVGGIDFFASNAAGAAAGSFVGGLVGGATGGALSSAIDNPGGGYWPTWSGTLTGLVAGGATGAFAAPGIALATLEGASDTAIALMGAMGSIQGDTMGGLALAIYNQQHNQPVQPCP